MRRSPRRSRLRRIGRGSRGGLDVAFAALERAAAMSAPIRGFARYGSRGRAISPTSSGARRRPCGSCVRRSNSGGFQLTRPRGRRSISRRSRGHGPAPPRSGASRASRKTSPISGDGRGALEALEAVSVRSYWDQLDDSTRQHVSAIVERLAVPADDPQRLAALALIDPVHRGRGGHRSGRPAVSRRHARSRAVDGRWASRDGCLGRQSRSPVPQHRCGGIPVRRPAGAAGPVPQRSKPGPTSTAARWRAAITGAAEVGQPRRGNAPVPLRPRREPCPCDCSRGAGRGCRRPISLIDETRGGADADGRQPPARAGRVRARPSGSRSRAGQARRTTLSAASSIPRMLCYQPYTRGWALADLVDAAVHGDGDLDAGSTSSGRVGRASRGRVERRRISRSS